MISKLYDGQFGEVIGSPGRSRKFNITGGVRPGCVLSPRLFCALLPCMQMGENELEWVSVTSGNMNVLNSAFIFFVWAQQIYGVMQVGNELDWMSVT